MLDGMKKKRNLIETIPDQFNHKNQRWIHLLELEVKLEQLLLISVDLNELNPI